ncbi:MAG: bifunctional methylenetetrahydrofolate dehydrogenase/methenyltetrahydrofolate cyclohydrolase FolD [Proteobacteria bacterium]|nr:bifunctional methylenetetrahydrofolate dehydrogenase/methenyltetrahydrofolate cyclohydrolase FolD [Pseudomonadota bacterium]
MAEARIIDGKAFAARLRAEIAVKAEAIKAGHDIVPGLATVLVGENPASEIYVRAKSKAAKAAGMLSFAHNLPEETREAELLALIDRLNGDDTVNGILVQLPLPGHISAQAVLAAVDPAKDVDGFHPINAGRLMTGAGGGFVPCTPQGCMMLLKSVRRDLTGLKALVAGRSNIVGKPMASLLLGENCTVTMAHSRTRDLAEECRQADILIAAVGRPRLIKGAWIKPGATVIDVGFSRIESARGETLLVGDVQFAEAVKVAGAITPVPGGVGPMTIACLLRNTLIAACRQSGVEAP